MSDLFKKYILLTLSEIHLNRLPHQEKHNQKKIRLPHKQIEENEFCDFNDLAFQ